MAPSAVGPAPSIRRGSWTVEEDELLSKCIKKYGEGNWHLVPLRAGLRRCRKGCRLRWLNYLSPKIKRGQFSEDEIDLIIRMHRLLGNKWSLIAGRLSGRTANDVKNYWNTHLAKRQTTKQEMAKVAEAPRPHIVFKPKAGRVSMKMCDLLQKLQAPQEGAINISLTYIEPGNQKPEFLIQNASSDQPWWAGICLGFDINEDHEAEAAVNVLDPHFNLDDLELWDSVSTTNELAIQ